MVADTVALNAGVAVVAAATEFEIDALVAITVVLPRVHWMKPRIEMMWKIFMILSFFRLLLLVAS